TGKTLLGKAVAGEVGVPFIYTSATGFANMFMGVGNLRVMALFRKAKKFVKKYDGAVIFIDEIDAIGSRGAGTATAATEGPALLRPGRFDRKIHVGLPDKEGRTDVISYYLAKVAHKPLDIEKFAQVTIGYSPARIKNIINEALIVALQDGREALTWEDIWQAK